MINKNTVHNEKTLLKKHTTQWIGLTITNAAAEQIIKLSNQNANMLGLKITIKKSGCAGFTYHIEKALSIDTKHLIYEHNNGAKLFVPLDSMPFIDGMKLDYIQEGLNYMFKFDNPNAQYLCGCGASFNILKNGIDYDI